MGWRWPDFGNADTPREKRERERSIRDAAKFVESGRHAEVTVEVDEDGLLGWDYERTGAGVAWCGERITTGRRVGEYCERPAGRNTVHEGAGPCWVHERRLGRGTGAWVMAHAFAKALDVTPWEGLLWAVRIAAGRVAFLEAKLGTATCDADLAPNGELYHWVKEAELWHDKMSRVSKMAIDAGVAERLVRQLELEAQLMLKATRLTLDELGLNDDQRERALGIMSRNLLALEVEQTGVVRSEDERRE